MTDGIWGLIGVIIGTILSIMSQYFFEIRRDRMNNGKIFIEKSYQIMIDIIKLKNSVDQILNFITFDLSKYDEEEASEELYPTINYFSRECSNLWPDFKICLLKYFPRIIKNPLFMNFEKIIVNMNYLNNEGKIKESGQLLNLQNLLKEQKSEYENAAKLVKYIEEEYKLLIRKITKKKF
jgi:ribosomal protein S18